MEKHAYRAASSKFPRSSTMSRLSQVERSSAVAYKSRVSMARLRDPALQQLTELSLVTPQFAEEYLLNRRQALAGLVHDLMLIQKLYEGSPLEVGEGNEFLFTRAMELNAHLIKDADFGAYSNSEKINLLFRLRRAVEIIEKQYFKV